MCWTIAKLDVIDEVARREIARLLGNVGEGHNDGRWRLFFHHVTLAGECDPGLWLEIVSHENGKLTIEIGEPAA